MTGDTTLYVYNLPETRVSSHEYRALWRELKRTFPHTSAMYLEAEAGRACVYYSDVAARDLDYPVQGTTKVHGRKIQVRRYDELIEHKKIIIHGPLTYRAVKDVLHLPDSPWVRIGRSYFSWGGVQANGSVIVFACFRFSHTQYVPKVEWRSS